MSAVTFTPAELTDKRISLDNFNKIMEYTARLANMTVDENMWMDMGLDGLHIGVNVDVPIIPDEFGPSSIVGAQINMLSGTVVVGSQKIHIETPTVTVSEGLDVIGFVYDYATKTGSIALLGADWAPSSDQIKCPLWNVKFDGTTAAIVSRACRLVFPANLG